VGATKRPSYRVIAIDSRRARDGRALEILGFYNPLTDPATVQIDADKLNAWIEKGAKPSETVAKLMRQAGIGSAAAAEAPVAPAKKRPARKATPASKAKAPAAAAAAPEAEAATEATAAE
jgi:small subunit ribosomal protein S16